MAQVEVGVNDELIFRDINGQVYTLRCASIEIKPIFTNLPNNSIVPNTISIEYLGYSSDDPQSNDCDLGL